MLKIHNFNESRYSFRHIISYPMITIFLFFASLCTFEELAFSQLNQIITHINHDDGNPHKGNSENHHNHSQNPSQHDESGIQCCDQLLALHQLKILTYHSSGSVPLVQTQLYFNTDEVDTKANRQFSKYNFRQKLREPVSKENSYYLAFPSHAPPFSS